MDEKQEKLHYYTEHLEELPTLPSVATRILEKLQDPDYDINEIVDLILMDQVLTAKTFGLVNSAYLGLGRKVESVRQAILYLGTKEIRNVVLTTSLMKLFQGAEDSGFVKSFWEHSFACGLFSSILAKSVGFRDIERAYLGGLLHDIGEAIFILKFQDDFDKVRAEAENCSWDFHKSEQKVLGVSHTDIGPWLLERWNLNFEIGIVVTCHHAPEMSVTEAALVSIVNLADLYCRKKGFSLGGKIDFQTNLYTQPAWKIIAKELKLAEDFDPQLHIDVLDKNFEEAKEFINMIY